MIVPKFSNWKLVKVTAIAFLFIAINYVASANSELQPATFGIDHLLKLQTPSDVQIDPSGNWVAYVVQRNDEEKDKRFKQIWMTSLDGKISLPMTASYATASKPRWNPDGSALAFIGKRGDAKDTEKTKPQV
ncbi:MAG: dipeptidyl aminopeptidase/acylaminoacyl peptidase, partial [Paraglaciecola sp.]